MITKDGTFRLYSMIDGNMIKVFLTQKNNLNFLISLNMEVNKIDTNVLLMGSGDEELLIYDFNSLKEKDLKFIFKRSQYYHVV